ncbi:MAG: DegT/DnrJ/EryC1/StrS family aminotransferase, partial [Coriobacteriia bacterium]|nr:DegT/DnrJ/EryC1/StrS family aminotransferase [Coriobacteriia bacterium]
LLSLHGQTKDALAKLIPGSWEYDIVEPAWKCNMTDLTAALGLVQLKRYPELLERRRQLVRCYKENLAAVGMLGEGPEAKLDLLEHLDPNNASSCHLLLTRLIGKDQGFRNALIRAMAERGIACNVHYKPLPLLTAYRERGFDISDYPNAFAQFANELTLPLHTLLSDDDVRFIAESMAEAYSECERADA